MLNKYVTAAATSCVQKYVCVFYRDGKKGEERYGLGCGCWDHKGLGVEMGGGGGGGGSTVSSCVFAFLWLY